MNECQRLVRWSLLGVVLGGAIATPASAVDATFYAPGAIWRLKDGWPKPNQNLTWHQANNKNRIGGGRITYAPGWGSVTCEWSYTEPPPQLVVGRRYSLSLQGLSTTHPGPPHEVGRASIGAGANDVVSVHDHLHLHRERTQSHGVIPPPVREDYPPVTSDTIEFTFKPSSDKFDIWVAFAAEGVSALVYQFEPFQPAGGAGGVEPDRTPTPTPTPIPIPTATPLPGGRVGARMVVIQTFAGALPPLDTTLITWSTHVSIRFFSGSNIQSATGIFWQPTFAPGAGPPATGQVTFLADGRLDRLIQFPATDLIRIEANALIKWRGEGPLQLPPIERPELTFRDIDRGYYATTLPTRPQVHPALFFIPMPPIAVSVWGDGVSMSRGAAIPEETVTFQLLPLGSVFGNPDPMPLNVFTSANFPLNLANPATWPALGSIGSGWHHLFATQGPNQRPPRLNAYIQIDFIALPPAAGPPMRPPPLPLPPVAPTPTPTPLSTGPITEIQGPGQPEQDPRTVRGAELQDAIARLGQADQAATLRAFDALVRRYPLDPEVVRMWGLVSLANHRSVAEVRATAEAHSAARPGDAQALLLLGQAALFSDDREAGIRYLSQARAASPILMEGLYQEANRLLAQGLVQIAYVQYMALVWMQPADQRAYYGLGLATKAMGRLDEAKAAFQRYLQFDSKSQYAKRVRKELAGLRRNRPKSKRDSPR